MRRDDMTVFEFNSKRGIWKRLADDTFHLYGFFFRQGIVSLCKKGSRIVQKRRDYCNVSSRLSGVNAAIRTGFEGQLANCFPSRQYSCRIAVKS